MTKTRLFFNRLRYMAFAAGYQLHRLGSFVWNRHKQNKAMKRKVAEAGKAVWPQGKDKKMGWKKGILIAAAGILGLRMGPGLFYAAQGAENIEGTVTGKEIPMASAEIAADSRYVVTTQPTSLASSFVGSNRFDLFASGGGNAVQTGKRYAIRADGVHWNLLTLSYTRAAQKISAVAQQEKKAEEAETKKADARADAVEEQKTPAPAVSASAKAVQR